MAHINLLPWREELRAEKTRVFATLLGLAAALTAGIVLLINVTIGNHASHQQLRNNVLEEEITRLDMALKEIKELENTKQELLSRMEVIQSLQSRRPQIVHLFDEIVRTVPEGIYLSAIKQQGKKLIIKGVAESNGRVSAYMRNIDNSEWMSTPKLSVIATKKDSLRSSNFELITSQSSPTGGADNEAGEEL